MLSAIYPLDPLESGLILGGAGLLVLVIVLAILWASRSKAIPDLEAGLAENLAEYPPLPAGWTPHLRFEAIPVRLRLVVLASPGRAVALAAEEAEEVLQAVAYGLGDVARADRPRIRLWPNQLSQEGFSIKFFDKVSRGEKGSEMSRFVLVAGPAKAGRRTVLVGLALESVEPTVRGNVRMTPEKWPDKFRVLD